ncbi:unnamed protein product [Vitrella brassicaformis CCMP3155]|uniref:RAP domain-containing protein n=3 Tax=Vitrella brassicaformis TaxID=1169539 RepID=A0A0G4G897_VITBC|nr:unnamed protein product [Vitrella brassicaformis CCMP3155]|eukprot:CEM24970.1 unnamed protein product [Vitrella brassicaformis CCMP3155]
MPRARHMSSAAEATSSASAVSHQAHTSDSEGETAGEMEGPQGQSAPVFDQSISVADQLMNAVQQRVREATQWRRSSEYVKNLYTAVMDDPATLTQVQSLPLTDLSLVLRLFSGSGVLVDEAMMRQAAERVQAAVALEGEGRAALEALGHLLMCTIEGDRTRDKDVQSGVTGVLLDTLQVYADTVDGPTAAVGVLACVLSRRMDAPVLTRLVNVCSLNEMDLGNNDMLTLKLATYLYKHHRKGGYEEFDLRSRDFLSVVVDGSEAHEPPPTHTYEASPGEESTYLSAFEKDVSATLKAMEVPHDTAPALIGLFHHSLRDADKKVVYACETPDAFYMNHKTQRRAVQKWRYRVAQHEGWRVLPIATEEAWRAMPTLDDKIAQIKKGMESEIRG